MTSDEQRHDSLSPEQRQLIDAAVDGTASDDQLAALDEWLRAEPATRRHYRQVSLLHATLRWIHRGEASLPSSAAKDDVAAIPSSAAVQRAIQDSPSGGELETVGSRPRSMRNAPLPAKRRLSTKRTWMGAAVAGAVVAGLFLRRDEPDLALKDARAARTAVALLQSGRDCVWESRQVPMTEGTPLMLGQQLKLQRGSAKLAFQRGAAVVLEGPAEIELLSAASIRLVHGTVAVRVSSRDKEFSVISPDASIVDLGTSFGVHRGRNESTQVEVFEGAVEVFPNGDDANGKVLGVGASARVRRRGQKPEFDMSASTTDHFANVLELLWADVPHDGRGGAGSGQADIIRADFADGPVPGSVDTFYGAVAGRGWETPWMAWGNPVGELTDAKPLSIVSPLRLGLRFHNSYERAVARLYGERPKFDPNLPHVISWQWRFDGKIEDFSGGFLDRVSFYGNPYFRRNSWPTNTWLVGVVAGDEIGGKGRRVLPMQWYAYNGHPDGQDTELDRRNLVGTGMMLKPGVAYRFAVAVYPDQRRYDVAIRDDEQTFTRAGLCFRNPSAAAARVVHFTVSTDKPDDDLSFTIDSIRIDPLGDGLLASRLEQNHDDESDQ